MNSIGDTMHSKHHISSHTASGVSPSPSSQPDEDTSAFSILSIRDFQLKVSMKEGDREPRILDSHLTERLGLGETNPVQRVVLEIVMDEVVKEGTYEKALGRWGATIGANGRLEFWLTENQAVAVIQQLEVFGGEPRVAELHEAFVMARQAAAPVAQKTWTQPSEMELEHSPGKRGRALRFGSRFNPSALDRMYGLIGARLREERWFLKQCDSSRALPVLV